MTVTWRWRPALVLFLLGTLAMYFGYPYWGGVAFGFIGGYVFGKVAGAFGHGVER